MGWWTQVTHPTRAVIGIPSDVLFATDSADLESSAVGVLTQAATSINSTSGTVHILGYTDSQGSPNYNLMLSVERAQSVADEFIILGVSRMRLEVSGMGDANPVASNATASGRAENRRVDIELPQ
jgi:outer membrane protein OmpA-like peptidoglycan-associated protein